MNLSEAIREALAELGTDTIGAAVKEVIHKRHRGLREKLDTPTFSTTFSTERKKAKEAAAAAKPATTKEVVAVATVRPSVARKTTPTIPDELTPEETAIAGVREAYKQLAALVGSDVAKSITARLAS